MAGGSASGGGAAAGHGDGGAAAQLVEYRQRHRARFEAAPTPQGMGAAGAAAVAADSAPVSPGASAQALGRQLAAALDGGAAATAAENASGAAYAALDVLEVQHGVLQWALLSELAASAAGAPAASGWWGPTLQAFSCLGARESGGAGGASAGAGASAGLGALLRSRPALEALLLSGGCSDWPRAVAFFCSLLLEEPSCARAGLHLRLAAASALCVAEGQTDTNMQEAPIDPRQRFRRLCALARDGELFRGFDELCTWHLRYVVGSWHGDECLAWARANVDRDLRRPDKIGKAAQMVQYRDFNDAGVSVQEGLRFYGGAKTTMAVLRRDGGVCGAVSKFGASSCQAFGVPAMPVGQPGHCALLWRGPEGEWELENDNAGLSRSRMHDGIQRTWRGVGPCSEEAGVIAVMECAQASGPQYARSELLRLGAPLAPDAFAVLDLLLEAVHACPHNLPAWAALLRHLVRGACADAAEALRRLRARADAAEDVAAVGPRDLSLLRPVLASSQAERAPNVVDGTSSEWFPELPEPQWLEVDLGRPCRIERVRVQWWGDYGAKTRLQVSSSPGGAAAAFTWRGRREAAAEFNGWSEWPGWAEPSRVVRLDLDGPSPDCFGLGKQYGVRQVSVLGRRCRDAQPIEEPAAVTLEQWAEAAFATPRPADTQARRFLKAMVQEEAVVLAALSAPPGECVVS